MMKKYACTIEEKETGLLVGFDDVYFDYYYTEASAIKSAKEYIIDYLISNEYKGKTVDDFDIIVREVIE